MTCSKGGAGGGVVSVFDLIKRKCYESVCDCFMVNLFSPTSSLDALDGLVVAAFVACSMTNIAYLGNLMGTPSFRSAVRKGDESQAGTSLIRMDLEGTLD